MPRRRTSDKAGHALRDLAGVEELKAHALGDGHERQGAELQTKLGCERVPLCRAQDRVRESASLDDLFARELAAVVAERDLVDADDRDVNDVRLDPRTLRSIEQPPGAFNVGAFRVRVGGYAAGSARKVSDDIDGADGLVEAVSRGEVAADRSRAGRHDGRPVPGEDSHVQACGHQQRYELGAERSRAASDEDVRYHE